MAQCRHFWHATASDKQKGTVVCMFVVLSLGHILIRFLTWLQLQNGGRDSSVCSATRYGHESMEIVSRCGRDFRCRPDIPPKPTHPPVNRYGSFLGIKKPERGAGHHHHLLLGYKWVAALSPTPLRFCISMSWGDLYLYRNITLLFLYNTSFKQVSYFLESYIFLCTPHGVI